MDSIGEVYNPNGTPVSSGSGSSGSGSSGSSASSGGSSGSFTAQDLMDAANSGDAGKIIQLVSQTGTASPETQTVTMSAADLGLPSGGTVTLTVTGSGVNFSESRAADADGFVRFEVPKVETNSWVTIELSVQDSNGTIFWYGRDTQQVKDGGNLEVRIVRRFWTLPESLTVAVSPSAIAYDDTAPDSTYVDFSITNLTGAPDDAVFTYSWKDETGAEVGTGATLRRTAGQMLGAGFTPLNDSETKTYSVEVTYTDATGSTVTSSGSGTATIATTATLVVEGTQPGATDDRLVLVVNKGTPVSLTAKVLCYGGTPVYTWSSSSAGSVLGSDISGTDTSVTSTKGATTVAGGTATVTVTADLGGGRTPLTKVIDVYVLDVLISGTSLSTSSADPTLMAEDGSAVNLTASLAGIADLEGAEFTWEVSPAPSDPSKPFLKLTPGGAGNASCSLEPKQAADDTHTLTAKTTYRGVEVQAERYIKVIGLRLTGGADVLLLDHSSTATNTLSFTLTPVGVTLADLGSTVLFNLDDSSIATASPASTGAGCTVKAAQAGSPAAFTYATGVITVTVTAEAGPDAIPLSYEKEIVVADLVVKRGTYVVPTNGNIIAEGSTVTLTAELKGPPAGSTIDYAWTESDGTKISVSPTSGDSTTLTAGTGLAAVASSPITVKATYKGTEYSRDMGWSVGFSGSVADFLSATFAPNTSATPCTVEIMGAVSTTDLQNIVKAIGEEWYGNYKGVYVKLDLSFAGLTVIGDNAFDAGTYLKLATRLKGIVLPSGLTTIGHQAFNGCGLSGTLTIPASCTRIGACAFGGTGITALADESSRVTWKRLDNGATVTGAGQYSGALDLDEINNTSYNDVRYYYAPES